LEKAGCRIGWYHPIKLLLLNRFDNHHTAVVRILNRLGSTHGDGFTGEVHVPLNKAWHAENLRAVIFVQAKSGEIAGATVVSLADWRY
jgi:hypothetical protein